MAAATEVHRAPTWALPAEEALERLASAPAGLDEDEARRRLGAHGRNEIAEIAGPSALAILVAQFRTSLIYILLLAAVLRSRSTTSSTRASSPRSSS